MFNVLITASSCNDEIKGILESPFADKCNFIYRSNEAVEDIIDDVDIIIGGLPIKSLSRAKNLKWVQMTWAGTDIYTRVEGFPEGVLLTNASGAFGKEISEYVIGTILARYIRLDKYLDNQKKSLWKGMGAERNLDRKRVLIFGTGDIGTNIAKRLKSFGTVNIGVKRVVDRPLEYFDDLYTLDNIDELLPKADIVIGCLPNTDYTQGLLDYRRLSMMKKDSTLVNVGRGTLIVTEDLIRLLHEGHFADVILDVTDVEPLPQTSPLWNMSNVLVTPHISGQGLSKATEKAIWEICIENIRRYITGESLKNLVDIKAGY